MKIEIELEEVERLRRRVKSLESIEKKLELEIREAQIPKLREDATELAEGMFKKVWFIVCDKLGMDKGTHNSISFSGLERQLGNSWYDWHDKITVNISTSVGKEWMSALIRLGVKEEKIEEIMKKKGLKL